MVSPSYLVSGEVGRVALVAVPPRRHRVRPVLSVAARRPLPAVVLLKADTVAALKIHGSQFIQPKSIIDRSDYFYQIGP